MEDGKVESARVDRVKLAANKERVVDEAEEKYRFGCGPCAPACLQKIFGNYIFFAFILYSFVILETCIASGMFERTCTNEYKRYYLCSQLIRVVLYSYIYIYSHFAACTNDHR